jgi:hypothetical protein
MSGILTVLRLPMTSICVSFLEELSKTIIDILIIHFNLVARPFFKGCCHWIT